MPESYRPSISPLPSDGLRFQKRTCNPMCRQTGHAQNSGPLSCPFLPAKDVYRRGRRKSTQVRTQLRKPQPARHLLDRMEFCFLWFCSTSAKNRFSYKWRKTIVTGTRKLQASTTQKTIVFPHEIRALYLLLLRKTV